MTIACKIDILKDLDITRYTIHDDGSVTAHQKVYISNKQLAKIPVKFKKIEGDFNCNDNNLTSLINAPQIVEGYFDCCYNYLTNLEGAPQIVKGCFDCADNYLISLEGSPQEVKGNFYCFHNNFYVETYIL